MSNVTETSRESYDEFVATGSHDLLMAAVHYLLQVKPRTIEDMANILNKPQSTISGVLRPLVIAGKAEHLDFAISKKFKRRVRTWAATQRMDR